MLYIWLSHNEEAWNSYFSNSQKDDDYSKNWREKLIDIITRERIVDADLKGQIKRRTLFICEKHYAQNQINRRKLFQFNGRNRLY